MAEEIWRDIPEIPTHQVSNMGNLRSKNRLSIVKDARRLGIYARRLKGKNLRLNKSYRNDRQAYVLAHVNDKPYSVHRLVAKAFLAEEHFEGAQINHKNGNKHDNRVENLEWVTASQNELHSYERLGKKTWNKGKRYNHQKATEARKRNHLKACKALLILKNLSKATDEILAEFLNMSRRQINQNLQVARKGVVKNG